jgi:hypothetical protein
MRGVRVLVVLFFLATSSTAFAATKAIKFGKLVDGIGGVFTNAVVIVDDDRVQSVATGSASIPSGAEVIDLSRYTGIPGLIDAHTHITYYWDGMLRASAAPGNYGISRTGERAEGARGGRDDDPKSQRCGRDGSGDARLDKYGQDDRSSYVRLGPRHPDHA